MIGRVVLVLTCVHSCATPIHMGRSKSADRTNVTSNDGPVVAVRLTPLEDDALRALVDRQRHQLEGMGIAAKATGASVLRMLLRQEAQRVGAWPATSAPQVDQAADLATVLDAATAELARSNVAPLVLVPAVVRASKLTTERAHAALLEAVRRGALELRPESGMGRLSKADAALCLPGPEGSTLSVLRVVGAEVPAPKVNPTKSAKSPKASDELDPVHIHKRYMKGLKAGVFTTGEAATAIFGEDTTSKRSILSRFKNLGFCGKGLSVSHAPATATFLQTRGC